MRKRVLVSSITSIVALATLCLPSASLGSVRIGVDTSNPGNTNDGCSLNAADDCTITNTGLTPSQLEFSPIGGMIIRWRVRGDSSTGASAGATFRLRVLRALSGGAYAAVSTGTARTVTSGIENVFPERLPITAGEAIGVNFRGDNSIGIAFASGPSWAFWRPALPDGGPGQTPLVTGTNEEAMLNADVAAPPTSVATATGCGAQVTVTSDPDPSVAPAAAHVRIDGGADQRIPTTGRPGQATLSLPAGVHSLEVWGEDTVGQQEATHHVISAHCTPTITGLRQSARKWRAGNKLPRISRKAKEPVGTTFSFTLNGSATVRFAFIRRALGRRTGKGCVKPSKKNRGKRKCVRFVTVGILRFTGHAGLNKVHFEGNISKRKRLKPGRYTVRVTATANGLTSARATKRFKIV